MPAGPPPGVDQPRGHGINVLARLGGGGRTGPPEGGGRYGLLLVVLVGTYLFSAFNGAHLATETQIGLFSAVLLLALRSSLLPGRWPVIIGSVTVAGSAAAFGATLTGTSAGTGAAELWKALLLLLTAVLVVRRVLVKPSVTIQSIYGALSAYLIVGLMFAACYAAIQQLGEHDFFANHEPVSTQTFQYFSFTTLTTLGYGDFTAAESGGRSIAVMEALTGQVFLATLVARLVTAYRAPDPKPRTGPSGRGRLPADRGRLPEDVDGAGDDEDRD
jgi:hypothetical protein